MNERVKTMYIRQENVEKILEIMKAFPDADSYKLDCYSGSGIGNTISLTMNMIIKDYNTQVKVEITGVDDW